MKKNPFRITRISFQGKQGRIRAKQSLDRKTKPESGKTELGQGCEIGLWEEAKPTSVERFKEESVTKKDEVEKDGSPLDEGRTKPITEGDSVMGGEMI
jgi:hypothetical protein